MFALAIKGGALMNVVQSAINTHALKSSFGEFLQFFFVAAFASFDDGSQQVKPLALGLGENAIHHLRHRLCRDFFACGG